MTAGVETRTKYLNAGRPAFLGLGLAFLGIGMALIAVLALIAEARIAERQRGEIESSLRTSAAQAARTVETRLALLLERVRASATAAAESAVPGADEHSLLRRLSAGPDPLIATLTSGPTKDGAFSLRLPPRDAKAGTRSATLTPDWLSSTLAGTLAPDRGFLVVAPDGKIVGAAGAVGTLVFKAGERMPIPVLGAASSRTAVAQADPRPQTTAEPPGVSATTGSSDHIAEWRVAGRQLLVSTAAVEPGLLIVALSPAPDLITALGPILGLALAPLLLGAALVLLLWRQGRALTKSEASRASGDELLELAVSSTGCGLWDWDVEGGKIFWSAALLELVGRPAHGVWLTLPETYQVLHPTEVPKLERLRQVIADGAPSIDTLIRLQSLQGRTIWCEARLRPWQDPSRERIVGLLIDVTREVEARLAAEATSPAGTEAYDSTLRATIAELEDKRGELAELSARHASETTRADQASRAKNEFLANMSHELKTPLNAIIGFSEIMHSELYGAIGDERYREYSRDIHAAGRALSQLIDDILEMSKIEAGSIALELEPLNLAELVEACVRLVEPRAREASVTIENRVKSAPAAYGDRRATKRILISLLSNSVKFTHRGGRITLAASAEPERVTLSVADDGIGIPESELPRIGRPFEQVEKHQSRRHRGTGLGLAISMALCEMQGGALKIESAEGVGTTVFLTLPRHREEKRIPGERRYGMAG
jgi:signal transduction histidine kinase